MGVSAIYWCLRKGFPVRSLLSCDLPYYKLPASTEIPHPFGITIANDAAIGEDCRISPNVTVGVKTIIFHNGTRVWHTKGTSAPIIGSRVFIGAGAIIFGDITIADDCIIGAGSVVSRSFTTEGTVIAGNPAKAVSGI
jgi:serine O-acetyltransferase